MGNTKVFTQEHFLEPKPILTFGERDQHGHVRGSSSSLLLWRHQMYSYVHSNLLLEIQKLANVKYSYLNVWQIKAETHSRHKLNSASQTGGNLQLPPSP